jgi:hypothetical protein
MFSNVNMDGQSTIAMSAGIVQIANLQGGVSNPAYQFINQTGGHLSIGTLQLAIQATLNNPAIYLDAASGTASLTISGGTILTAPSFILQNLKESVRNLT